MHTSNALPITITDQDLERLQPVLDQHGTEAAELLEAELYRARVVPQREVPTNIVTMNTEVVYQDCTTGTRRAVRIVYPGQADIGRGWVSVLAPIGSALLGLEIGQEIDWPLPSGERRIRVAEIRYQPEAAGDYEL